MTRLDRHVPPSGAIAALNAAFRNGETTAEAAAAALIARLRARPTLAPFAAIEAERALAQARHLDAARAAGGPLGPLSGVALAHKDMFDRAGRVTGFGAGASAARRGSATATVLARLDAAGQIDLGRLAMSEFAMGPTGHNAHHGMPDNPAVPGAITGGSSSGSGAAVAAGLVPAALGSDTGGSIRLPAACCGIVGFKPTQGRVPVTGAMPLSWTQDCIGPLAATVADARLILALISGPDAADPACAAVPALRAAAPLAAPAGLRIGFDAGRFIDGVADPIAETLAAVRAALAGAGARCVALDLGFLHDLSEPANVTAMSEASTVHADRLRRAADSYGPQVRSRLVQAAAIPAQAYLRAQQIRAHAVARMRAEVFARVDLLILPTLYGAPPQAAALDVADGPGVDAVVAGLTRLTRPASFLGLPALSLPAAWTAAGPLSLQILGPHWSEDAVAGLAAYLEAELACGPAARYAVAAATQPTGPK